MDIHKLYVKPEISKPKTIQWIPFTNLKHPPIKINPVTWKIFTQENITLKPKQVTSIALGLGFKSTTGVVLVSLDYHLRYVKCSLQNEISFGDVADILVVITNNSNEPVKIKENELICFVYYRV